MLIVNASLGSFCVGRNTATGGTAFASLIPPFPAVVNDNVGPLLYSVPTNGRPNWMRQGQSAITHVTTLVYTTGGTLHQLAIMRPKNWTTLSADAAGAQTTIKLTVDPGIFSTNYNYPLPGNVAYPGVVVDDGIDSGDYACYQLPDGTWFLDTAAGTWTAATGAVTMTSNVPTGGAKKGAPFFLFQTVADLDPATGLLDPQFDTTASTTNEKFQDYEIALVSALHPGDPMVFYSPNSVAAGKLTMISGYYGQY